MPSSSELWRGVLARADELDADHLTELDELAPPLLDSVFGSSVNGVLGGIPESTLSRFTGLSYAMGRSAAIHGDSATARLRFTQAQALTGATTSRQLRERLAFEIGCLMLEEHALHAAELMLAWGHAQRDRESPDLLQLEALIAEGKGRRDEAVHLYRRCLGSRAEALSPLTRVLALRNLAGALTHQAPVEAASLYKLAVDSVSANQLERSAEPALRNGLGYSLLCNGDYEMARAELETAHGQAAGSKRWRIAAYAQFNLAIADELESRVPESIQRLEDTKLDAEAKGFRDVVAWCLIRKAWLLLKLEGPSAARLVLGSARRVAGSGHLESLSTLEAFLLLVDGRPREASRIFSTLARSYASREDAVTAFALLLWQAVASHRAGLTKGATTAARAACDKRAAHGLRVSPNWWSSEILDASADLVGDRGVNCHEALVPIRSRLVLSPALRVVVTPRGITVDGVALHASLWTRRAGRKVLAKLLAALVSSHPNGVSRDKLADALWPESEGDAAIRNLQSAVKDLRRVLASAPGLRLVLREGRYRLEAEETVIIDPR